MTWLPRPRRILSRKFFRDLDDETPDLDPRSWPHWPAGSLPHSLSLDTVSLYRCQLKRYMQLGPEWYRMFWDVERKWSVQNRFAGEGIYPGHFFSVNLVGAVAELRHTVSSKNTITNTHFCASRCWQTMFLISQTGIRCDGSTKSTSRTQIGIGQLFLMLC